MEINDLIGEHFLSGVDMCSTSVSWDDSQVIRFVLDDKVYEAIEDPHDGYRSYMGNLHISNEPIKNLFPPHKVNIVPKDNGFYENDIIQFIDDKTKKIVLEIGTDCTDDYYPYCVMRWNPENLAINNKYCSKIEWIDSETLTKD